MVELKPMWFGLNLVVHVVFIFGKFGIGIIQMDPDNLEWWAHFFICGEKVNLDMPEIPP